MLTDENFIERGSGTVFGNILAEIKKMRTTMKFIGREELKARHGELGGEPIFRMVEAERVHTNFLCVIPASAILILVEVCGMIWAVVNKIKFDYCKGFIVSCLSFTAVAVIFVCFIERKLKDTDFSLTQKKTTYIVFWAVYCLESMSFSIMELLDRGTVNNYLCFIFLFTVLPVIEPLPRTAVLVVTFLTETAVMIKSGSYNPDVMLICFVAFLIASVASYATFFRYMSTKITEKSLEHFANGDHLTMLTNRRGFASLGPELKKYCENKSLNLLVIMADIDNFKAYNDSYGHIEGDICLKNVAARIRENFSRSTDICARYGGEEFLVMSAIRDDEKTLEHIRTLLDDVETSYDKNGGVTMSVGVCISDTPSKYSLNELIKIADDELYNAKANGKNCFSYKGRVYKK